MKTRRSRRLDNFRRQLIDFSFVDPAELSSLQSSASAASHTSGTTSSQRITISRSHTPSSTSTSSSTSSRSSSIPSSSTTSSSSTSSSTADPTESSGSSGGGGGGGNSKVTIIVAVTVSVVVAAIIGFLLWRKFRHRQDQEKYINDGSSSFGGKEYRCSSTTMGTSFTASTRYGQQNRNTSPEPDLPPGGVHLRQNSGGSISSIGSSSITSSLVQNAQPPSQSPPVRGITPKRRIESSNAPLDLERRDTFTTMSQAPLPRQRRSQDSFATSVDSRGPQNATKIIYPNELTGKFVVNNSDTEVLEEAGTETRTFPMPSRNR